MGGKYRDAGDIDLDQEEVYTKGGERLTEARAAEMAEKAVQRVRGRSGGRPSLTGGSTHSPTVSYRVPADLRARAEQVAEQRGISVSELGRQALEHELDQAG